MKDLHPSVLMTISQDQVDNLIKLADFLEVHIPPPSFSMGSFISCGVLDASPREATRFYNECGTTACAIGHGPLAGIVPLDGESWNEYSERNFGCSLYDQQMAEFDWMFGGTWEEIDNTPEGAVARIRWFLKNGLPDDYRRQMYGSRPLCYVTEAADA